MIGFTLSIILFLTFLPRASLFHFTFFPHLGYVAIYHPMGVVVDHVL